MANFLVNEGKAIITAALVGLGASAPTYAAWGTGTGQTETSTDLAAKAAPTTVTAVTGTDSQQTTTVTNDTYRLVATITAGSTLAITEAGSFNNATIASGDFFQYGDFSTINVTSGDSIEFTFNCKFTSA